MKKDIHPKYTTQKITCSCDEEHEVSSTKEDMKIDICSQCHPFFTGNEKTLDTAGRVDKFNKRFASVKK